MNQDGESRPAWGRKGGHRWWCNLTFATLPPAVQNERQPRSVTQVHQGNPEAVSGRELLLVSPVPRVPSPLGAPPVSSARAVRPGALTPSGQRHFMASLISAETGTKLEPEDGEWEENRVPWPDAAVHTQPESSPRMGGTQTIPAPPHHLLHHGLMFPQLMRISMSPAMSLSSPPPPAAWTALMRLLLGCSSWPSSGPKAYPCSPACPSGTRYTHLAALVRANRYLCR